MRVTIVGPNLPPSAPNDMVCHAEGCADLRRGYSRGAEKWTVDAATVAEVVDAVYGPSAGSFYDESATLAGDGSWVPATWRDYVGSFHFAPCLDALPVE